MKNSPKETNLTTPKPTTRKVPVKRKATTDEIIACNRLEKFHADSKKPLLKMAEVSTTLVKSKKLKPLKTLSIDQAYFSSAYWGDQNSLTSEATKNYFDIKTGDVLFLQPLPDEAPKKMSKDEKQLREQWDDVAKYPKRFVEIYPNDGPHCLEEFVQSDWTDDEKEKGIAVDAYYGNKGPGLYRKFKKDAPNALDAFRDFQETVKSQDMEAWLKSNGIIEL